jgi:TPR repeat protein
VTLAVGSGKVYINQLGTDMRALWTGAMLLMLVMPGAAVGDQIPDFSDGLSAYHRQDYTTALRLWRLAAEQGYADAQVHLGVDTSG